ncbi:hypothetical protein [uncultured Sphingomonas sp.]|uniref:hypothetical protein n=1 Tax=uncultured Sphingomonas sp. TaxID=158754 RepID=UPI002635BCF8|nr:hypothetical protein [uncultured Sphingomonas sp.]
MAQPAPRHRDDLVMHSLPLPEPRWIAGGAAGDSPVRALQDRLLGAFGAPSPAHPSPEMLPLSARVGVMLGASLLLWAAIGGAIYALS